MFNRVKRIVSAVVAVAGTLALAGGVNAAESRGTYSVRVGDPAVLSMPVVVEPSVSTVITEPAVISTEPVVDQVLIHSATVAAPLAGRFILVDDDGSPTIVTNDASMYYTGPRFENTLTNPVVVTQQSAVIETQVEAPAVIETQIDAPAVIESEVELPAVTEPAVDLTERVIKDTTTTTTRTYCK